MATNFTNQASIKAIIGGIDKTITSNEVISTLATDLSITKSQQADLISQGQKYTCQITNPNPLPVLLVLFTDTIPAGMSFVTGSFKVNNVVTIPALTGQVLTYTIPTIAANATVTVEFSVLVV